MRKIIFLSNGSQVTTKLSREEAVKRFNLLDSLIVLTEGYQYGHGVTICQKAVKAYYKSNDFTGIIRLNNLEKEFLMYILDNDEFGYLDDDDIECLKFYSR